MQALIKYTYFAFGVLVFNFALSRAEEELTFEKLKDLAEQGSRGASFVLGNRFSFGEGVAKDDTEAAKWYLKSAEQGLNDAQLQIALCYSEGKGVEKNEVEAANWYLKAANQGNDMAQHLIGDCYAHGRGVAKDLKKSVKWYLLAAEAGNESSQCKLGLSYEMGYGVKKDLIQAALWYRRSAAQGECIAQYLLGVCYEFGKGLEKDANEAASWYLKSAKQGCDDAQFCIGAAYFKGSGVVKNDIEAYKWWALASTSKKEKVQKAAQSLLDILEKNLSRSEIARGQELAREFSVTEKLAIKKATENNINNAPRSTGTGFFITSKGHLITNCHVIKGGRRFDILTNNGLVSAELVKKDESNDLALLKVQGEFAALAITSSRKIKLGASVATIGFPNVGIQGFAPKYAKGEIASLSGFSDDAGYFQISVPTQPGNSGGALFDELGNVVGVVSAKLNASTTLKASGSLPENVNYAVKSSFLLGFLESIPQVNELLVEPATSDRKNEDVLDAAQKASALVIVY